MTSPDASLWNDFLAGNKQVFERIFLAHYDDLFRYGMRLTGDEEVVKDCIQNLFQRLWQRRKALEAIAEIKPYLFAAMRHHITDELRAQKRRSALQTGYPGEAELTVQHSPEDFLIAQQLTSEQQSLLLGALNQLSNRHREALYLKFFDGFAYDRIAEIMGLNQQSVRNLVHQAIKRMRLVLPHSLVLLLNGLFLNFLFF
ncbi:sigma-70 family RNA polymerase sigma factor [Hymenobacter ginsengisoli]|uniref:Sigma-70 family RNA polymerase sigma factor n=1 Tax=Hymenobacter ginsengisoli TaxID=1051626 RepID=A0ABP8Q2P8_9BACT|nr:MULTISPECIES: sigma-70 family RNA polymerase sigma factor [unclassified Hymenobacter]MBO2033679.1 sigma-70 family RNA polymerase sigma factor [Hymenobacter sp. BT559]